MSNNALKPLHPPQILLDQFQRPVAPIPGITLLEHFTLEIYKQMLPGLSYPGHKHAIRRALDIASEMLEMIHKQQSESVLSNFENLGDNASNIIQ